MTWAEVIAILKALTERHRRDIERAHRIAYDTAAITVDGISGLFARRPRKMRKYEEYYGRNSGHQSPDAVKARLISWGLKAKSSLGR